MASNHRFYPALRMLGAEALGLVLKTLPASDLRAARLVRQCFAPTRAERQC